MLADFQSVLDRLGIASCNGEKAMSFCPAHEDRTNPSLSLRAENGRLLLHCFAGCHPEDILSEIGLQMKDLFVKGEGGSFVPPNTPARLHAQSKNRILMGKTSVHHELHAQNAAAHSMTTPSRRSYRRTSCEGWV
jgi:hypothetical protein